MSLPGGGRRWFVIVNPVAGGGRGLDHFPLISKLLRDAGIQTEPVFTEHKFHATELTVSAVKQGFRRIIAVGGDGTLHEVVNGLFIQQTVDPREVLLAVVAVGAGNDWIRTFGVPNRYQDAIRAIKEGHSFLQDVGVVSYEEAHYRQHRYMANVAGMGFDAMVVKKYAHLKKKGHRNKWLYTWCMIRSFFSYKSTGVKVWIDDRLVYNNLLMSIAIGVCKYNGGGMQQLPEAVADDGLLDVSLIRPVHFWHILFRFRYLFNGGIYRIRHILQERGSRIRIESSPEISVEVDGELLGESPLEFSVLHRAVRIVVSEEFLKRESYPLCSCNIVRFDRIMRRRPESVGFRPSSVLPLPSSLCGLLLAGGCCACCRCCCALLLKLSAPVALRNSFSECERVSMIFYRRIGCVPDKIVIGYPLAPRLSSCRNPAVFAVLFFNLYRSCCSVFSPGACVGLVCSESMNKVFVKRKLSGRFSYL